MRSIRISKVQPSPGNVQQKSQTIRFTNFLPHRGLAVLRSKDSSRTQKRYTLPRNHNERLQRITHIQSTSQQQNFSETSNNNGSHIHEQTYFAKSIPFLVPGQRSKTYGYSVSMIAHSRRRKEDLEDWSWQSSQMWRSAISCVAPGTRLSPSKKRWKPVSLQCDILHYTPNYMRVRSRLRGRILRKVWFSLRIESKRMFMESALIHALNDCPVLAFDILQNLLQLRVTVPRMIIQDVLARASAAKLLDSARKANVHRRTIKFLFSKLGRVIQNLAPDKSYTIDPAIILAICRRLSRRQLRRFLDNLPPDPSRILSCQTVMQLIHISARHRLIRQSISLLQVLLSKPEHDSLVQWACVRLIRIPLYFLPRTKLHSVRVRFIHEILQKGIVPNDSLRNAIIQTFMEGDEIETAWAVFRKSVDRGLSPTKGTFFALLQRYPYHEIGDILEIVHIARTYGCLDSSLGHRALDAVDQLNRRDERCLSTPFQSALRVYLQFFDIKPLIEIGFVDKDVCSDFVPINSPRLTPRPKAINMMIRTFCRQFTGSTQIWESYQKFITLAFGEHNLFAQVALNPWPFEYFMAGMSTQPDFLRPCAQVLQDMLDQEIDQDPSRIISSCATVKANTTISDRQALAVLQPANQILRLRNTNPQIAQPRSTTWNILLSSLINAHQLDAAEELVEMMQEEGFKPTLVTWNTLIDGFSNAQDSRRVALAVEQMENQQFVADDRTRRALTRVLNRTALFAELDKALHRRAGSVKTV